MGDGLRIDPASVRMLAGDLDAAVPALTAARRRTHAQFGPEGVPATLAEQACAYVRAFAAVPAAIEAMEISAAGIADGLRAATRTVQDVDEVAGGQIGQTGPPS